MGTASGLLDLLAALLVLEGGVGNDVANLYDVGDANDNLGWLTQDTLTGLDMASRTGARRARPAAGPAVLGDPARRASFTIMLSQVAGRRGRPGIGAVTFAAGTSAEAVRFALQSLLFPTTAGADDGVSMSCGDRERHPLRGQRLRLAGRAAPT